MKQNPFQSERLQPYFSPEDKVECPRCREEVKLRIHLQFGIPSMGLCPQCEKIIRWYGMFGVFFDFYQGIKRRFRQ